jgi:hypothetical protein
MKKTSIELWFDTIGFFYPNYPRVVQDTKKRKKKVTMKRSKIPKIKLRETPSQALEEIHV